MSAVPQSAIDTFHTRVAGIRIDDDTATRYETWIQRFEAWHDSDDPPTVGEIIDFDQYLNDPDRPEYPWEQRRQIASYAYATRITAVSAIKLWTKIHYDKTIEDEPQNIVYGEPDEFDPTVLTREEIQNTIENAHHDCDLDGCGAALRVSYDAILRAKELTLIEFEDFDYEKGTLYVRAVKGSNNSTLRLGEETTQALRSHWDEYEGDRKQPFYNSYGRPWKPNAWVQHFLRNHHDAGSHSFGRHSAITHRLNQPGEFETIDQRGDVFGQVWRRARHANPSMTSRYARLVDTSVPDWAEG